MYPPHGGRLGLGVTRKLIPISLFTLVASAGLLAVAPAASAHHPEIAAQISCGQPKQVVVSFTATSWMTADANRRVNNEIAIDIVVGGVTTRVTTGAFTAGDGYTFGGTVTLARPTGTVVVRATAIAPFGPNGEYASQGETRETSVLGLPPCPVPVPTASAPVSEAPSSAAPAPVAAAPTVAPAPGEVLVATSSMVVTVVPTTTTKGAATPTTVQAQVEAVTFVVGASRLPETGSRSTMRLAGFALALVGMGALACALARRPVDAVGR